MIGQDPPPYAMVVDVSGRDITAINSIEEVLKLNPRSSRDLYEARTKEVCDLDKERDDEMMKNINWEDFMALKSERERKLIAGNEQKVKKRLSSFTKLDTINRRFSNISLHSDANTGGKSGKNRRHSLIMTGKIE